MGTDLAIPGPGRRRGRCGGRLLATKRGIHHLLSRGERRNSLARAVFHGQRGQLRRHYQVGQETSSTASAS